MAQGFGRDLWCDEYLITTRMATGWRALAQAIFRRLTTPRGTLGGVGQQAAEASVYGVDLSAWIGSTDPDRAERELPGRVQAEILKDDRVQSAAVRFTRSSSPGFVGGVQFSVVIEVTAKDPKLNFRLTLSASQAVTELVSAEALAA